ncbi:MAG: hypothetical protein KatS3mg054_0037 [Chloroflexus sp.]|nr:MAG: hypothetical protein KatS3mg054_0037 [Chloroflexus sp.]
MINVLGANVKGIDIPGVGAFNCTAVLHFVQEDVEGLLKGWTHEVSLYPELGIEVELWVCQDIRIAVEYEIHHGYSDCVIYLGIEPYKGHTDEEEVENHWW